MVDEHHWYMFEITTQPFELKTLNDLVHNRTLIGLSSEVKSKINSCRSYLDQKMKHSDLPIYGINTGFGALCNVKISPDKLSELQVNLVRSHACGTGDFVPKEIIKLMLLLKIKALSLGYSGVQLSTIQRLIDFYNEDILPVVYTQGSLGASGDLAPLAHIALSLIGEGEVWFKDQKLATAEVLKTMKWAPVRLQSKEGLALLNGTQFMASYAVFCLLKSYRLSYFADLIGTLSLEAFDGLLEPFSSLIHKVRPHKGQLLTAQRVNAFLEGSELIHQSKIHVQDPYSFRCIPQVHGATKDTLEFVTKSVMTEVNSVTDNPNIFVENDAIVSGGNFHGQPLAFGLDFLKIAVSELGNISERRTYQLISGHRNLPSFLVKSPGLNSGLMIPQYTAASIVSANKQLATPASVDSIVSSNGQEDHVSMGANAAIQAYRIVQNVEQILAIELLNSSQAMTFKTKSTSPFLTAFLTSFRSEVPLVESDRVLYRDMGNARKFLNNFCVENAVLFEEFEP